MTMIDLGPAAQRLSGLVAAVPEEALKARTPCAAMTVGDLLDHVDMFALAFTAAARKSDEFPDPPPPPAAAHLRVEWRTEIPDRLAVLAQAWRAPDAWTGVAKVGGGEFPGELAGNIALGETLIHGWDLARAIDAPYSCDDAELEAVRTYVTPIVTGPQPPPEGLFAPRVAVPENAPLLDQVVALTGRDPAWRANG
jgi:uncharacterized protein (TIGR03086 family)